MAEEIPKGTPVKEFCERAGINYAEFAVAKAELIKFGAVHMYKDILYVRPEDEENVKAYFLRRPGDTDQSSQTGPPMPSPTAMIVSEEAFQPPENTALSQDKVDALLKETVAEKSADPTVAPESTPSTEYNESDSYKKTDEGDGWEETLTARLEQSPPKTPQRTRLSQPSNLATQLNLQAKGTMLMYDMIRQAEKERDTQQETYGTERQVSAARPYQSPQELILREYAKNIIIYVLEENAIPVETARSVGLACFGMYAVGVYGLEELTEPQGSVDAQKLKEALEGFLTDFFSFSKSRYPSILDVEEFRTRKMYVREFDDTMTDFIISLGLKE